MRPLKCLIFALLYFSGASTLYRLCTRHRARVLCYHRISAAPRDPLLDVTESAFTAQMEYLKRCYRALPLDHMIHALRNRGTLHSAVAVTFDDGTEDWASRVLPVLERFRIPATLFVCTGYVGQGLIPYPKAHVPANALTVHDLCMLHQSPYITIGAHTHTHPRLTRLSPQEIYKELDGSKQELESLLQKQVRLFAYPFGHAIYDYDETAKAVAAAAGYDAAFTLEERTATAADDPWELPRLVIFNEPLWMFTVRVSGILDDTAWWIKKMINKIWKKSNNHPAWFELPMRTPSTTPRVSVLIRARNVAPYLAQALESILVQDSADWEALILDDASTDGTADIALAFYSQDRRFRYIRTSRPFGRSANANLGLKLARGAYIAVLDGDDRWSSSQKLAREVTALEENPEVVLVAGGFERVDESGARVIGRFAPTLHSDQEIRSRLLIENIIPHSCVLYRKVTATAAGGYRARWKYTEDYELWLRMGLKGKFQKLPEICCQHRFHQGNISIRKRTSQTLEELMLVIRYGGRYPNILPALLTRLLSCLASLLPPMVKILLKKILPVRLYRSDDAIPTTMSSSVRTIHAWDDFLSFSRDIELKNLRQQHTFFQGDRWLSLWWKHFATLATLHVIAIYDGNNRVRAVFPGAVEKKMWLGKKVRILTFLGYPLSDVNDVWYGPADSVYVAALGEALLSTRQAWDVLSLMDIPENSLWLHTMRTNPEFKKASIRITSTRPLLLKNNGAAPGGDKLPALSKNDLHQRMNKLKRVGTPVFTLSHPSAEIPTLLPLLFQTYDKRSLETHFLSPFRDPGMREFFSALLDNNLLKQTSAHLATLQVNNVPIAFIVWFQTPTTRHFYLNTFDPDWKAFSPASLLLQELLRDYYASADNVFDFGRGEYDYKKRFANASVQNYEVVYAPYERTRMTIDSFLYKGKRLLKRSPRLIEMVLRFRKRLLEHRR